MYEQVEKPKENKSQSLTNAISQRQSSGASTFQFVDNRPEAIQMRKLQEMANNYKQKNTSQFVDNHPEAVVQRKIKLGFRGVKSLDEIKDKEELTGLLKGEHGVNTLEDAFHSKHTFWFRGKPGEYRLTVMEDKVEEKPKIASNISVNKPSVDSIKYVGGDEIVCVDSSEGACHLKITGLIGCVGIIVEKNSGGSIRAAATHLLDKHYLKNHSLDEGGREVIDELLSVVGTSGITITLVVSSELQLGKMGTLVSKYISEKGGESEYFSQFTSKVYYSAPSTAAPLTTLPPLTSKQLNTLYPDQGFGIWGGDVTAKW